MRLPGWPGWGDGPPGRAVPPARRLPCCPPPPPPPCCAAFIIFLYLLLLFWNQIFTCNKNRKEPPGQVKLVSRVVSSYSLAGSKGGGGRKKGGSSRSAPVDVLFNVVPETWEAGNFHCLCRCPSVRQTSDNYRLRYMSFCEYTRASGRVMIHACFAPFAAAHTVSLLAGITWGTDPANGTEIVTHECGPRSSV